MASLDLTDPTTVAFIQSQQSAGVYGGKLVVNGSGMATGGTLILTPSNMSAILSAENIPFGTTTGKTPITVTFKGFQSATGVTVDLSSASTTPDVVINGTVQFVGPPASIGGEVVASTLGGTVFSEGTTGVLKSDGTLTLTLGGNAIFDGSVTGTTATTVTTTIGGSITFGGKTGATTGVTNIVASGSMIQGVSTALIYGSTVNLTSTTGSIGTSLAVLGISAPNVSLHANDAGVDGNNAYVLDTSAAATNLNASSAAGVLQFTSKGSINMGFNLDAQTIILTAAGSIGEAAGSLNCDTLTLLSTGGSIGGPSKFIQTDAVFLSANAKAGSVYINDVGSVTINAASSAGSTFNLQDKGTITAAYKVIALTTILQTNQTQHGPTPDGTSIYVDATVGSLSGFTTLSAYGTGNIIQGDNGLVLGGKLSLSTGTGSIGTEELSLTTQFAYLTLSTNGEGNAYISNTGTAVISSAIAGGTFKLVSTGGITDSAPIMAAAVNMQSGGSIALKQAVGEAGVSVITLSAAGAGNLSTGVLMGASVTASSGTGRVILGNVQAPLVTANTSGTGLVSITATGATTVGNNSASGGNFTVTDNATLTVNNITTANGGISLTASSGSLILNANSTLNAVNGPVLMQAGSATGTITLGANANVYASSPALSKASVSIYVGTSGGTTNTTPPTNMTVQTPNGGQAYFGANSILVKSASSVYANGATVGFNSPKGQPVSTITLDGGNHINANHVPIDFQSTFSSDNDLVVDTGDDGQDAGGDVNQLVDALQ